MYTWLDLDGHARAVMGIGSGQGPETREHVATRLESPILYHTFASFPSKFSFTTGAYISLFVMYQDSQ